VSGLPLFDDDAPLRERTFVTTSWSLRIPRRRDPHGFMVGIGNPVPLRVQIARGVQEQIAAFFASDGTVVIHPEPARFFDMPISGPLPEGLNYIVQ
jgi:hypothetical protein